MQNLIELLRQFRDNRGQLESDQRYRFIDLCLRNLHKSKAQLLQDIFVLYILMEKKNGFFVEFGAANGIDLSNTYHLEKDYGWNGILAEPSRVWHPFFRKPDRQCIVDFRCVTDNTGDMVEFTEASSSEYSTISTFVESDMHCAIRRTAESYLVESVSLIDLLDQHNAPIDIDYLSIDTEGSEYMILKAFDFSKYHLKIITVEHNGISPNRENIHELLVSWGFVRLFENISRWDDWYINTKYCWPPRGITVTPSK
jgi:FkbM family methyltransferase